MFQTAPKSCTITIAERPDPEFRTPSWTPKSWPATETYAWCRGDPPRGSRTPPTPRLRVTAVARTDSLTGTPIDQARHPPRTPPLPTKHPSPLCLGVCSPRAPRHRHPRCYTFHSFPPLIPIPDLHRRSTEIESGARGNPNRRNGDAHRPRLRPARRRGLRAAPQGIRRSRSRPRPRPSSPHEIDHG